MGLRVGVRVGVGGGVEVRIKVRVPLEAHRVLAVEGVAVDAAHEAHVIDVVLD